MILEKLPFKSKKCLYTIIGTVSFFISIVICLIVNDQIGIFSTNDNVLPSLMPWQNVGGCGAGGSGGGSSGIKWVGEGVSGGRIKVEVMPKVNFGQKFSNVMAAPRLSYNPVSSTEIGLSMPIGTKQTEVQYQENMDPQTIRNGGRGDVTVDVMRNFGSEGQYFWQCAFTFPTGESDAQRGTDRSKYLLPQSLQMGQGVYSATLGLFYSRDVNKGMYLIDGFFNYPFMIRFDKKNKYLDTDYKAYKNVTENRERFYYKYWLKPYGESDRGDYYPPSLSFDAVYAYRGVPKLVQSFQFLFSVPLGVRWSHWYKASEYNPFPDPDNRAWDIVLSYGMEFSRDNLPLYLGIGLPIHDKADAEGDWNAPDWENIGNEWLLSFGMKAAIF